MRNIGFFVIACVLIASFINNSPDDNAADNAPADNSQTETTVPHKVAGGLP